MVAARRGSPLLIGVRTAKKLKVDFVDVDNDDIPGDFVLDCSWCWRKWAC